jgi:dephospho-CoA kinase
MKTKIIGLTGGIGSGKTTVANYFESFGVPVYIADDEAKKIMQTPEIINAIVNEFGSSILTDDVIDRKKLAKLVFEDKIKLQKLNQIIHPAVKKHFELWLKQHATAPFVIKEAAILFESGSYKDCDQIICVVAPLETRIQRVLARDQTTFVEVQNRINNQWSDEKRISKSDYIIENIDITKTKSQVQKILKKLTNQ